MEDQIILPNQILKKYLQGGLTKVKNPLWKTFLYGVLAGAFVGLGACASSVAMHGVSDIGLARVLGGLIFPIGLVLIIFLGGELFTGNCLLVAGIADKRFTVLEVIKNLFLVYLGNLVGSAVIALLVYGSGQFHYSNDALGAYVIKTAVSKAGIAPETAVISGILCNILVCAAVLLALAAKDATGKLLCIFFPIFVFVICGFEHCVANMYYLLAGIFAAADPAYLIKAQELYNLDAAKIATLNVSNMFLGNLLPVTVGNFLGGAVFLALPLYFLYRGKKEAAEGKIHRVI